MTDNTPSIQAQSNAVAPQLVLGIETAILSGSLALFDGHVSADTKNIAVARSERLLSAIDSLLASNSRTVGEITTVAISVGPGSFTGIRIGIATAIGLASALNIPCVGVSTLDVVKPFDTDETGYAVVPLGRDQFAVRYFDPGSFKEGNSHTIQVLNSQELVDKVASENESRYYLPFEAHDDDCSSSLSVHANVMFRLEPTALLMCHIAANGRAAQDLTPQYIRRES
jgi:tRNA threonylcarbamoyl adenosine modification protein YeaZ